MNNYDDIEFKYNYTIDKLNTLFKNILLEKNYINQEPLIL